MTVTTLLQGFSSQAAFTSLLLLSSKGENPAQSKSDSIAGKKVFWFFFLLPSPSSSPLPRLSVGGESWSTACIADLFYFFFFLKDITPLTLDHR